jgi:septal ring factor EnvC (AmiA/AmiB activator)
VVSSARYKRDIRDMGAASSKLSKLRPVTFRYNNDPTNTLQYGLVAEEVAKVYPELVVDGADGKVMTVRYQELVPMLLNQAQRQAKQIRQLRSRTEEQAEQNRQLTARLEQQSKQIARLEGMVKQAIAAQKATGQAAETAFNR